MVTNIFSKNLNILIIKIKTFYTHNHIQIKIMQHQALDYYLKEFNQKLLNNPFPNVRLASFSLINLFFTVAHTTMCRNHSPSVICSQNKLIIIFCKPFTSGTIYFIHICYQLHQESLILQQISLLTILVLLLFL